MSQLSCSLTCVILQVLRWSALAFGVFYGFSHQSSLTSHAKAAKIDREYQHKESLIQQAKAEWLKKTLPPEKKTETGGGTWRLYSAITRCRDLKILGLGLGSASFIYHSYCARGADILTIVITNPDDKNFDLEAYLTMTAANSTK